MHVYLLRSEHERIIQQPAVQAKRIALVVGRGADSREATSRERSSLRCRQLHTVKSKIFAPRLASRLLNV